MFALISLRASKTEVGNGKKERSREGAEGKRTKDSDKLVTRKVMNVVDLGQVEGHGSKRGKRRQSREKQRGEHKRKSRRIEQRREGKKET